MDTPRKLSGVTIELERKASILPLKLGDVTIGAGHNTSVQSPRFVMVDGFFKLFSFPLDFLIWISYTIC